MEQVQINAMSLVKQLNMPGKHCFSWQLMHNSQTSTLFSDQWKNAILNFIIKLVFFLLWKNFCFDNVTIDIYIINKSFFQNYSNFRYLDKKMFKKTSSLTYRMGYKFKEQQKTT